MRNMLRVFVIAASFAALGVGVADAATRGVRIKDGAAVLAEVVDGVVTGEVSVPPGETSADLEVFWLDDVLAEVQPAGRTLGVSIADPLTATHTPTGTWTFTVTGAAENSTTVTLTLLDGATAEYTSPAIPLHVEEEHAEADGLILRQNGEVIATVWQGAVSGLIDVAHETTSDTIHVTFLTPDSVEFVPHVDDGFSLVLQMADSTIADPNPTGDWSFTIDGLVLGMTSLRVGIFHVDHVDFLGQPIEVHVEEEHAEADGYVARRNGVAEFSVWQGAATGFAVAPLGADSDTLEFVFLDVDSVEFVPHVDDGFALVLQVGDTLTATHTPRGDWAATLHGLAAGATTLRVGIFHVDHVDFLAVPVPLQVYAGAGAEPVAIGGLSFAGATPNPFRAATTLHFTLGRAMDVDLSLFDVSGRRVATLARGPMAAGAHAASFRAHGLEGGVYFARLVTPAGTYSRRVILAR